MKKFVGHSFGSGCAPREKVSLCVEATDAESAESAMDNVMASRYPCWDKPTDIREATVAETETLPIDVP